MSEAVIEAVVQVGDEETRYLRRGRGARVVVVLAEDEQERLRLLERFSGAGCVIAPVLDVTADRQTSAGASGDRTGQGADGSSAIEARLLGVIDGLGLDRPGVVLSASLAHLAADLACRCGDAIELVEPTNS